MESILGNDLIKKVISLDLPVSDFAIMGGGTMFAIGIKELNMDVDLIARGDAWEKAKMMGEVETPESGTGEVVRLFGGEVEIFNSWAPGEWNVDELIDDAFTMEGLKFVKLETVLQWMKLRDVPKAKVYVQMIEDYLKNKDKN